MCVQSKCSSSVSLLYAPPPHPHTIHYIFSLPNLNPNSVHVRGPLPENNALTMDHKQIWFQ